MVSFQPQEIRVVVEPSSSKEETTSSSVDSAELPQLPNKDISRKIAIASTLAALGLFVFTRLDFGVSLMDLSAVALPYEQVHS